MSGICMKLVTNKYPNTYLSRLIRNSSVLLIRQYSASRSLKDEEDDNKPLKFMGSKAQTMTMKESFYNPRYETTPRIQKYSVVLSLASFMIYFCILREENDIDTTIVGANDDIMNPAVQAQLEFKVQYARQYGLEHKDLLDQLNKIRKLKGQPEI